MKLLLEQRGADVVITEEVVKAAATCGQEAVLRLFEDFFKISVSQAKWSVARLYNAAKDGKVDKIERLLAEGVEPDVKNLRQVSPLWIAATNGHYQAVQSLLVTQLVDVNSKSISGRPPIFWAAAEGHKDIVKLLLEAGADPRAIDENGDTPLSIAKYYGEDEIERMMAGLQSLIS